MDDIKISLSEVSETASQIRNYNSKLDNTLSFVAKTMNELNNIWQSEGQEVLLSRFMKFAQKFLDESEVIESYARFLDDTVSSYDTLESTIVANASNFN